MIVGFGVGFGVPRTRFVPVNADTCIVPHTVPAFSLMSDAFVHLAPVQYCMVVLETAAGERMQT